MLTNGAGPVLPGFDLDIGLIALFVLVMVRMLAFLFFAGVFGPSRQLTRAKVGLAVILAVILVPVAAAGPRPLLQPLFLALLLAREILIGFFFAVIANMVVGAAKSAGEIVSVEMGFGIARVSDPNGGGQSEVVGILFEMIAMALFLALNIHHVLFRAMKLAFDAFPPGELVLPIPLFGFIDALLLQANRSALMLAAPILLILFAITFGMTLLAKAVPEVHLLDFGFPARVLMAIVATGMFVSLLGPGLGRLYEWMSTGLAAFLGG